MFCDRTPQVHIRQIKIGVEPFTIVSGTRVQITSTPCHFGGRRQWFLCPNCGRRCAILYPRSCRLCDNGRYSIECLSPQDRRIDQAIKRRSRLGQVNGGIVAPFPAKPKWMRWHTYLRLREESQKLESIIWATDRASFGL